MESDVVQTGDRREEYDRVLALTEECVVGAVTVSFNSGGIWVPSERELWATQLFTKFVGQFVSFVRLLPGSTAVGDSHDHWDWFSVATLARVLIETYHAMFYVWEPGMSDEEKEFRRVIILLHGNQEKWKLYRDLGAGADVLRPFEEGLSRDRAGVQAMPQFQALPKRIRSKLLSGTIAMHLTHEEIAAKLPFMGPKFKALYRLFSIHVHSAPMSFMPMSNERGRGLENSVERWYMTLAMEVVIKYATGAVADMARRFPDELKQRRCEGFIQRAAEIHTLTFEEPAGEQEQRAP